VLHTTKAYFGEEHRQSTIPGILGKRGRSRATSTRIFVRHSIVAGIINPLYRSDYVYLRLEGGG
jgi:hypothetical protein